MGKWRHLWAWRGECVRVGPTHSGAVPASKEQDNGTPWYKSKLVSVLGEKRE